MPRLPDAKARGPLSIRPRNPEEEQLFQEFRRICRKDGYEYMDLFKPIIERVVLNDNPQLHFKPVGNQLVLSKKIPDVNQEDSNPRVTKRTCLKCGGEGCQACRFDGWVTEEAAP